MTRHIPLVSRRDPAPYQAANLGFYIKQGKQRYNRALYGAARQGSRFTVFAGDVPEWMLYHASGAGYAMLGVAVDGTFTPLSSFASYDLWYGGGKAVHTADDPTWGKVRVASLPDAAHAAALFRVKAECLPADAQLCLVFGGIDRMGDSRNLDAGYTEQEKTLFHEGRTADNRISTSTGQASVAYGDLCATVESDAPCEALRVDPHAFTQNRLLPPTDADAMAALRLEKGQSACTLRIRFETCATSPAEAWQRVEAHVQALAARAACASDDATLDAAVACLPAALEGMWLEPYYLHGAWSWRIPLLRWRSRFGPSILG